MGLPLLLKLITLRNVHPILTHVSNGLTPAALLFALLSLFYDVKCLSEASYYMAFFVALITPITMLTGVVDWKYRYEFRSVPAINKKIVTAVLGYAFLLFYLLSKSVLLLSLVLVFFAITGEYGGRLVHGAANLALVKKYEKKRI